MTCSDLESDDELASDLEPDDEVVYAFGVGRAGSGWPRRLLHVPTMTSYSHERGHYYGPYHAPKFNILSYTWGRWQQPHGLSLSVKGITWQVPPVREDCFTVAAFAKALEVASEDVEFVWVDVACIDQEHSRTKMAEVGRQAQIFGKAEAAYVWLHTLSTQTLRAYVETLASVTARLQKEIDAQQPEFSEASDSSDAEDDYPVPECFLDEGWIDTIVQVLSDLRKDPWFTSLWTLQEMFLRTPILLSQEAEPMKSPFRDGKASTTDLSLAMDIIQKAIEACVCDSPSRLPNVAKLEEILSLIDVLGFNGNIDTNACVLYSASRFRVTMNPLDRVYGIMQVFGFKLGTSKHPGQQYTLEELEVQLGAALAERSPVWSQLWIHTRVAEAGKSWLINPYCTFPTRLSLDDMRPESHCSITVTEQGIATFVGGACAFASLAKVIRKIPSKDLPFAGDFVFDVSSVDFGSIPAKMLDQKNTNGMWFKELCHELVRHFDERLRVLFLGVLPSATDYDIDISVGLLVMENTDGSIDRWQRIGLCLWAEEEEESAANEGVWGKAEWTLG